MILSGLLVGISFVRTIRTRWQHDVMHMMSPCKKEFGQYMLHKHHAHGSSLGMQQILYGGYAGANQNPIICSAYTGFQYETNCALGRRLGGAIEIFACHILLAN